MRPKIFQIIISLVSIIFFSVSCTNNVAYLDNPLMSNILNYIGTPDSSTDRSSLAFSDQGAWFAYGFSDDPKYFGGFSGPFLMTQENGIWCSAALINLTLVNTKNGEALNWGKLNSSTNSYRSHLEKINANEKLKIKQHLFFSSPHSAIIRTKITNTSNISISLKPIWNGWLNSKSLSLINSNKIIEVVSKKSNAKGYIKIYADLTPIVIINDSTYSITLDTLNIGPGEEKELTISQTFIFPEYDWNLEQKNLEYTAENYYKELQNRINEKEVELNSVSQKSNVLFNDSVYADVLSKCLLTLQNNWRVPAGELKHSGLFPSYHYIWFHGFWAWDSWKHAVALANYNPELAQEQIRAMFHFQDSTGFVADCVYRDTTIEIHNYRNTKPPLSAWAVWEVYKNDKEKKFLKELYPKIKSQHDWWYLNRDHDKDSLCEYGSTDGTLIAAKWESGMDNAVRFDNSKILKNSDSAYSLNQESVDLNSYLYAEKILLAKINLELGNDQRADILEKDADILKKKIQSNFYDSVSGWFYDISIDGKTFIYEMGCEGWIPLWANAASLDQAESVKTNMMSPDYFNVKIPLQTLSASNSKFEPDGGYWRGPNWLDQSYFGIVGLKNYDFNNEANDLSHKLLHNSDGVLEKGKSIRENYNPITGDGLESENFSWSAAHLLLLLLEE